MSDLLAASRATERRISGFDLINEFEVVTSAVLFNGGMAGTDATGKLQRASAAGTQKVVGVAQRDVLSTEAAGTMLKVEQGIFCFVNSSLAALTNADRWKPCYVEDDQTVAKTGSLIAGTVYDVDSVTGRVYVAIIPEIGGTTALVAGGAAITAAGGQTIITATDNAVITFPAAAGTASQEIRVICSAANGAALVSVSPAALDAVIGTVVGVTSGGVVNKDWRLTKATQKKGDYCAFKSDGANGWYIIGGVGVWASEP